MYKNNNFSRTDDWLLNMYFNQRTLTNLWVYGNHVFLLMLYLCYHTSEPEVRLFGSSICVWKVLAFISAPWSVSRLGIMLYLLITSLAKIAHHDNLLRVKPRQEAENRGKLEHLFERSGKPGDAVEENLKPCNTGKFENLKHSVEVEDSEEFLQTIINRINSAHNDRISDVGGSVCSICRNVRFCQLLKTRNRGCLIDNQNGFVRHRKYINEPFHC